MVRYFIWLPLGLLLGCSMDLAPAESSLETSYKADGVIALSNDDIPPLDEEGCPGIYAQDLLPTFELTIAPEVMAGLYEDWLNGVEINKLDRDETPYHPLAEFRYGDIAITNALIRLRGNPEFWLQQNKMQFQIAFDRIDPNGRFLGQRKVLFDAATFNRHFMRDRLSLWLMRQAGVRAPCANNARLEINGEYYGLFTSLEKLDDVFLARVYPPEAAAGDLWKRTGWELKTNLETTNDDRLNALLTSDNPDEIANYLDVEQAILVWAVDAIIPNSDGPWAGGLNFYLYDNPQTGKFEVLPWDLDNTFTRLEYTVDPYTHKKPTRFRGRELYEYTVEYTEDDTWFNVYIDTIDKLATDVYLYEDIWDHIGTPRQSDLETLRAPGQLTTITLGNIDTAAGDWSTQVQQAAYEDVNKPYTNSRYDSRRSDLADFIIRRQDFVLDWLKCWKEGGTRNDEGLCEPVL